MYSATWKAAGLSIICNSICCEDHFEWHRINCLSAGVEDSSYIVKKHSACENYALIGVKLIYYISSSYVVDSKFRLKNLKKSIWNVNFSWKFGGGRRYEILMITRASITEVIFKVKKFKITPRNVYNFDNREKVNPSIASSHVKKSSSEQKSPEEKPGKKDSNHINLFEGIRIFDPVKAKDEEKDGRDKKRAKKEQPPRVITPEDEKYRLGYGIVGKGTKLPWYLEKPKEDSGEKSDEDNDYSRPVKKSNGKKTVEEFEEMEDSLVKTISQ
uniref:Uncharacterized protein n=1 Tax=Solanum lycopersicum TaxID=4081 RepID=A0A3Q7HUW4_SOLLC